MIRLSLASMLTALSALAVPVVSIYAQVPNPVPSAEAGASQSDTSAYDQELEVPAQPTTAESTPKSESKSESAEPDSKQADVIKGVIAKKQSAQEKKARAKRDAAIRETQRQNQVTWMRMQMMMRQAQFEMELTMSQLARMEWRERREAEERIRQLDTAVSTARASEFQEERESRFARDNPEQYRRYVEAQIQAQYAQQQAIQNLAQALRAQQAQQGRSAVASGGTSGGTSSPSGGSSSGGSSGQSVTPSPGGGVARSQPTTPPSQGNNTANETRAAEREAARRNK